MKNIDNYKKNIEISFIISLVLQIILFFSFPIFEKEYHTPVYYTPSIYIEQIPVTIQKESKPPPPPSKPFIPVADPEMELLDDIVVESEKIFPNMSTDFGRMIDGIPLISNPRQIIH